MPRKSQYHGEEKLAFEMSLIKGLMLTIKVKRWIIYLY